MINGKTKAKPKDKRRTPRKPNRAQTRAAKDARAWMLEDCAKSGLTAADVKALGFKALADEEWESLGLPQRRDKKSGAPLNLSRDGYLLPYSSTSGKPLPMFRFRYRETERTIASGFLRGHTQVAAKYAQPAGSPVEAYFAALPGVEWGKVEADPLSPLWITEGEKKAAMLCKLGLTAIGLGGVWSFGSKAHLQKLIPSLQAFAWRGRDVTICFDSDIVREDLMPALLRLADALKSEGATVRLLLLPAKADGARQGVDDYAAGLGFGDAARDALKKLEDATPVLDSCRALLQINSEAVFVEDPPGVVLLPTAADPKPRRLRTDAFVREVFANRKHLKAVPGADKPREVSTAREWVEWPARATVRRETYAPGEPLIVGAQLNLWLPSGIVARKGSTEPFDRLLERLVPNADERGHVLRWAAYPLQYPGRRSNWAVLLWSTAQGTGKSELGRILGALHGASNFAVIGQAQLAAVFNDWLKGKTFIMGSELCGDSMRDARTFADTLKPLVSDSPLPINEKFQPTLWLPNVCSFYLTSNHATALHLTAEARRYMVIEGTGEKMVPAEYAELDRWRKSGGLGALLYALQELSLSDYQPGADAPQTAAREDMIQATRSDEQQWAHELAEDPAAVLERDGANLRAEQWTVATAHDLLHLLKSRIPDTRCTAQRLGGYLADARLPKLNSGKLIRLPAPLGRERIWWVGGALRAANVDNMEPKEIAALYAKQRPQRKVGKYA